MANSGALKIAEVSSRFTNIDKFVALVESVGFTLESKVSPSARAPVRSQLDFA